MKKDIPKKLRDPNLSSEEKAKLMEKLYEGIDIKKYKKESSAMMISPESYYREELVGKTPKQILNKITSLRRAISKLKKEIEHPDYVPLLCPSEDVQIACMREYIERAKQALLDMGAEYVPGANERRAIAFDEAIKDIQRVELEIGGELSGWRIYTVHVEDPVRYELLDTMCCPPIGEGPEEECEPVSKAAFCEHLATLHIGEWRRSYDSHRYGACILDGTQWRVAITYRDGRKQFECAGSNAFPYNFNTFAELIRATREFLSLDEEEG